MLELAWLPVSLARRALPPKRGCGHAELESTRVAMALLASVLTCHKHEPAACDAFNCLTGYIARREARLLAWRTCDRLTVDGRWRGGTEPNADSGYNYIVDWDSRDSYDWISVCARKVKRW